ncbi:MAG TPA: cyclic nucleotide-binding domain-containing protein [Pirellulales bacterium]|jgi:CRP-like cAMP-binding protein
MHQTLDSALLASIPLFKGLTPEQRKLVADMTETVTFAPGDTLLTQGKTSPELWVLLSGTCEVFKELPGAKHGSAPTVLAVLEPYSIIGEVSFFHPAPHSASVRAKTAVKLARLCRARFDELSAQDPALALQLATNTIASLVDRFRRMDDWVVELLTRKAPDERVPEWGELRRRLFDGWKV